MKSCVRNIPKHSFNFQSILICFFFDIFNFKMVILVHILLSCLSLLTTVCMLECGAILQHFCISYEKYSTVIMDLDVLTSVIDCCWVLPWYFLTRPHRINIKIDVFPSIEQFLTCGKKPVFPISKFEFCWRNQQWRIHAIYFLRFFFFPPRIPFCWWALQKHWDNLWILNLTNISLLLTRDAFHFLFLPIDDTRESENENWKCAHLIGFMYFFRIWNS